MSKKKAGDAKPKKKKMIKESGLGGGEQTPWLENKRKAVSSAREAGFDVEWILCSGWSLEEDVMYVAERAVKTQKDCLNTILDMRETLLQTIADQYAEHLSMPFRDGNDSSVERDALRRALSLLYLFPKLWKATDKLFSPDELDALDLKELVSERRKVQPRKRGRTGR